MNTSRVPVTVLTGFLGSGKTTLLNRILSENHGKKIAVIENEFGEIGIDNDLVIKSDEEIFEMNNGCICCTVRGDLIRILGKLMKRRDKFDHIMIETTGLADPGPVIQTFFMDDEMQTRLRLDAIITMVDAKHVVLHMDENREIKEQLAFADVVLLNKIDLADEKELHTLEGRIRGINSQARIYRTRDAAIEMDKILDIGGFDLDRILEGREDFLQPDYPFEWAGIYKLEPGTYSYALDGSHDHDHGHGHDHGHHHHHEHHPLRVLVREAGGSDKGLVALANEALRDFSGQASAVAPGDAIAPGASPVLLQPQCHASAYPLKVEKPGVYGLFVEHAPGQPEVKLRREGKVVQPLEAQSFHHEHRHDDGISSVGIASDKAVDMKKFNEWLQEYLQKNGKDTYRLKGILNFAGQSRRYVVQGVHMLLDGRPDREWGKEKRRSTLVFIGKGLNREELNHAFESCLA